MTNTVAVLARGAVLATLVFLAACAKDTVTLLPLADGSSSGTVAVLKEDGSSVALINMPYQVGRVSGSDVSTSETTEEDFEKSYGDLLTGLPPKPTIYLLYFEEGTAELTAQYLPRLEKLLAEIDERPGVEVQATGHTDTVGKAEDNDKLSLERAELIRNLLIVRGVPPKDIIAVGRGERELLVQTEDEEDEPRNRRVEVTIR